MQYRDMKSHHPFFSRTGIPLLLSALLFVFSPACSLLGPTRIPSTALEQQERQVDDPVAYKAALAQVKQANQFFRQRRYSKALAAGQSSLSSYETFEGYYITGSSFYQLGQNEDAIRSFEKAEKLQPDDEQLLLTMGTAYTTLGDLQAAQKRYARLHELKPAEPVYAFKLGTTQKNLGQYDDAYQSLLKAKARDFRYLDQTLLQLGDVCLELKKYDEARSYFDQAHKKNPGLRDAAQGSKSTDMARLLEQGNQAFAKKEYDAARSYYQKAGQIAPASAAPWLLTGSTWLAQKDAAKAQQTLQTALKKDAKNRQVYSLLGSAYHMGGQYKQALETLEQGLELAPESYEMQNKKGLVHRSRRESGLAIAAFHKALQIKSDYLPARTNMALAYLDDKRYADARREFKQAMQLDPGNAELKKTARLVDMYEHLDRGDRFLKGRNFKPAEKEYQAAQKIADDQALVYNSLGRLDFARRQNASAEKHFQKALELDANNVAALQGLLRVHARSGNRKAQATTLKRLQALTKNDIRAALALGRIKEDEGKLAEARSYYLNLIKQHPDEPAVKSRLGYVYYKQGLAYNEKSQYKAALQHFQKAEEYNPEIPQLVDTLAIVNENIKYSSLMPSLKRAEGLFEQARYKEALPLFEKVYAKLKRPQILVKIANCQIALGNEQKGLQLLQNAEGSSAEVIPIREAIYTHFLNKGQRDEAEKGFRSIIQSHPAAYFSWYKLGVIELGHKKYGSAIEKFNQCLIHKPDFGVAYIARGVAFYEQGQKERAQAEFQKAMKEENQSELASYNLGVLFLNDGLLDKAADLFANLIKADSQQVDARYQLSYIQYLGGKLDDAEKQLRLALEIKDEARLYHGLARIQQKRYLQDKGPATQKRLREIYQHITRNYPNTRYAEESRQRLLKLSPESKLAQPYPTLPPVTSKVHLFNTTMLYFSNSKLIALDSNSKQQIWQYEFPARPSKILLDHMVHVLVANKVYYLDPQNGKLLQQLVLKENPVNMIGSHEHLGLVLGKTESHLEVYNARAKLIAQNQTLKDVRYFSHNKQFYQLLPTAKEVALSRLELQNEADLKVVKSVQLPFGRLRARPHIAYGKENLVLYMPGSLFFAVRADSLELLWQKKLPSTVTKIIMGSDDQLLLPQATRLTLYTAKGDKQEPLTLKVPLASQSAIQLHKQYIMYVGNDRHVHQIDYKGQEQWKLPLKPNPRNNRIGQAWSLYY